MPIRATPMMNRTRLATGRRPPVPSSREITVESPLPWRRKNRPGRIDGNPSRSRDRHKSSTSAGVRHHRGKAHQAEHQDISLKTNQEDRQLLSRWMVNSCPTRSLARWVRSFHWLSSSGVTSWDLAISQRVSPRLTLYPTGLSEPLEAPPPLYVVLYA